MLLPEPMNPTRTTREGRSGTGPLEERVELGERDGHALGALDLARRGEFESTIVALAILLADHRGWLVA